MSFTKYISLYLNKNKKITMVIDKNRAPLLQIFELNEVECFYSIKINVYNTITMKFL